MYPLLATMLASLKDCLKHFNAASVETFHNHPACPLGLLEYMLFVFVVLS